MAELPDLGIGMLQAAAELDPDFDPPEDGERVRTTFEASEEGELRYLAVSVGDPWRYVYCVETSSSSTWKLTSTAGRVRWQLWTSDGWLERSDGPPVPQDAALN